MQPSPFWAHSPLACSGFSARAKSSGGKEVAVRILDGEQFLVRIFLGESDQYHHIPLSRALLERLRREGYGGAAVMQGTDGCGASSVIQPASFVVRAIKRRVLLEVVADEAHTNRLLPILDEMITGGALVTVERVRVVRYAAGEKRG